MFKRVLVGIDRATRGRDATALALALRSVGAEVTLAHARPGTGVCTSVLREGDASVSQADRLLASVSVESAMRMPRRLTPGSSVAAGLCMIAEALECDLLVVGATRRGRLLRKLLSDPTAETLRRASCVVAVAPDGYADRIREFKLVGVAYDGSQASDAALLLARRLAGERGASVSLLDVVAEAGAVGPMALRFQRAAVELQAAADRAYPEQVATQIAFGDPVEALSGLSSRVDILVAGSEGSAILGRLLSPRTAARLSRISNCPLLIMTEPTWERETIAEPAPEPDPIPAP